MDNKKTSSRIKEEIIKKDIDQYNDSGMYYVIKNVDNIDDLEKEWDAYSSLHKDLRKRSDEKSIELFGQSNIDRYEDMKSDLLAKDNFSIDDIPLESSRIVRQKRFKTGIDIKYTVDDIEKAKEYSTHSMRVIITPTETLEELESLWNRYLNQHKQLKRESDWKSLEIFGLNNQDHYEYLRSKFLYEDIDDEPNEEISPSTEKYPPTNLFESSKVSFRMSPFEYNCILLNESKGFLKDSSKLELSLYKPKNVSESIKREKIIGCMIDDDETDGFVDNKVLSDLPCMIPDDMIELGVYGDDNFYSEYKAIKIGENYSSKDWFDDYRNVCCGVVSENTRTLNLLRHEKLEELCHELSKDPDNNQLKQWILELGWNPEIEYTSTNRALVSHNRKLKLQEFYNQFQYIDVRGIESVDYLNESIDETSALYPLYIIILSSKSNFGTLIKKVTNSIYTHGAIAFDSTLNKIYSYDREGFTFDNLKKYGPDSHLFVNVIFLNKKDIRKIKTELDYYIANKKHTHYGYANLFRILKGKVKDSNLNLICTEFVDKLLKSVGIDITHKPSNLVTPKDLANSVESNNKIYTVYKGKTEKYNQKKVDSRVRKLMVSGRVFKELFTDKICEKIISKYQISAIGESKDFPIQFDKEGNLLIKNMKRLNYDEEYNKSHKLLLSYEKNSNIEGIKYELSKLWFMYHLLEKIRFEKNLSKKELKAVNDSRARIYNDFQKYLTFVQKKEKDFNFNEYYENSPFSDAAYKVNASTLKYTKDFIKSLII